MNNEIEVTSKTLSGCISSNGYASFTSAIGHPPITTIDSGITSSRRQRMDTDGDATSASLIAYDQIYTSGQRLTPSTITLEFDPRTIFMPDIPGICERVSNNIDKEDKMKTNKAEPKRIETNTEHLKKFVSFGPIFKDKIRIIFHDPATIVFWGDGTKTVVKCSKGETYNKYHGFCAALAKRMFGNNSIVNKIVKGGEDQNGSKKEDIQIELCDIEKDLFRRSEENEV